MAEEDVLLSCKEAMARGEIYYFSGKPCKHGHISSRLVSSRNCCECAAIASKSEIKKAQQTEYRSRLDVKENRKKYNKDYHKERLKNISEEQRKKARDATKKWRQNNIEHARSLDRQCAERRKEQRHAYGREYLKRYPEKAAAKERNKRARLRKNGGSHTVEDVADILRMQRNKCAYCRDQVKKYHVDHIIPIARGGANDRTNLQILCPSCNHKKWAKDPIDFARLIGRLL